VKLKRYISLITVGLLQDPSSPHPNGEHPGDIRENGEKGGIGSIKSERPPSRSGSSSSRSTPSLKSKDVRSRHLSAGPSSSQKSYAGLWFLFKHHPFSYTRKSLSPFSWFSNSAYLKWNHEIDSGHINSSDVVSECGCTLLL
jgi:hypothetical protein